MPFGMSIDIGYSNVKLVMGEVEAAPRLQLRPAGAAPVDRLPERMNAGDDDTLRVLASNEHYAACVSPERLQNWNRVLHENYPGTASYQALYHAALLLSEQQQVDWVVTGLPVSQWLDQARRTALAERLRLLATLGLTLLKEGSATPAEQTTGKPNPALEQKHDRIREKFGASLHL